AILTQHAGGTDATTLAYNADGTVTATDALGNSHGYTFATVFSLAKAAALTGTPYPAAGGAAFGYDVNGFLASRTDFDGNVVTYTHDARGNETSRVEAAGTPLARSIRTSWHPTFHLPTNITEPNRTTSFTYDANGNLRTRTTTSGTQTRAWTY